MYAIITRRTTSPTQRAAVDEKAGQEFFAALQQAPGFVDFYLVHGQDGVSTAVQIWEDRAQGDTFMAQQQQWRQTLDAMAPLIGTPSTGDIATHITARK